MRLSIGPAFLGIVILSAAGAALFQKSSAADGPAPTSPERSQSASPSIEVADPETVLPPNHPPIGSPSAAGTPTRDSAPALAWTAPADWQEVTSSSPMRLATYQPPAATPGAVRAEVTVTRAGGTTEANLERWAAQFGGGGSGARTERTVDGLHVTTLALDGTYEGGMMAEAEEPRPGWALLGAVVETPGLSYFFKMVGPAASVHAAHPGFDRLLSSAHKTR